MDRHLLYYTDNSVEGTILDKTVKSRLISGITDAGLKVVSVSQKPVNDFTGDNYVLHGIGRSILSMLAQIIHGLTKIPDDAYVFLAEHDVLYHKSHFDFPGSEGVNYNINCYRSTSLGYAYHEPHRWLLSMCSGLKVDLLREVTNKYLIMSDGYTRVPVEPGRGGEPSCRVGEYASMLPCVDIRHGNNISRQSVLKTTDSSIVYWGRNDDLRNSVGLNANFKVAREKPTILWINDVKGWAFDARCRVLSGVMKEYSHVKLYIEDLMSGGEEVAEIFSDVVKSADVVVVPKPLMDVLKNAVNPEKLVCILSGHRYLD